MRTRVVGVAVSPPASLLAHLARRLALKTATLAGLPPAAGIGAAQRIEVDGRWIGRGYGRPTPEGAAATIEAARSGLALDATYTAKAFAAALAHRRANAGETVLFWQTLSNAPSLDDGTLVPPRLARLFR